MKHLLLILIPVIAALAFSSCEPEEQVYTFDPEAKLRFSQDTVLFDTVFTTLGSTSRRLTVFNDHVNAVNIASIKTLDPGTSFNLTVNGERGNLFEDVRLLGKDSLLVLVDVLIDPQDENLPFIVEDYIEFETNENLQSLNLVAWGQDANFLSDSVLACQTTWNADRPYVIYNSILIDSLCTLTVEAGTRIFSHAGSSIFIKGSVDVQGAADNRVLISNDRFDDRYRNAPGQWDGIFFLEGSAGNRIEFADIRNADYGIWLGTPDNDTIPDLVLEGVVIENMARSGLLGFTSDLVANNTLVNNCAEYCVGNFAGGNYIYTHCSFANLSQTFFREVPLFSATDNIILADQSTIVADINLQLINSIVWGDFINEIELNNEGGAEFQVLIASSILKTDNPAYDINDNLLNQDPLFIDPSDYNYRLDSLSPAIDSGLDLGVGFDLDGFERDSLPDRGAFEWKSGIN